MTERGFSAETARQCAAAPGQTMLVVLRIVRIQSDIGVFLNDPGPRLAGSIEKDAFTSLLCLSGFYPTRLAARADASPLPLRSEVCDIE